MSVEEPSKQRPYRTVPHDMGLRSGLSLDNVQELLSMEPEWYNTGESEEGTDPRDAISSRGA